MRIKFITGSPSQAAQCFVMIGSLSVNSLPAPGPVLVANTDPPCDSAMAFRNLYGECLALGNDRRCGHLARVGQNGDDVDVGVAQAERALSNAGRVHQILGKPRDPVDCRSIMSIRRSRSGRSAEAVHKIWVASCNGVNGPRNSCAIARILILNCSAATWLSAAGKSFRAVTTVGRLEHSIISATRAD
jgi:hypothetical protein